jgi:hypothetical protein
MTVALEKTSYLTETQNGNISIDTELRSNYNAIWLLMQGSSPDTIIRLFRNTYEKLNLDTDQEKIINLLTLIMRLRDFRNGGIGRRLESQIALINFCSLLNDENITKIMLYLMASHYGRWDDLNDIRKYIDNQILKQLELEESNRIQFPSSLTNDPQPPLCYKFMESVKYIIAHLFVNQVIQERNGEPLTMCSKYFPTEGKDVERAIEYAKLIFPAINEDKTYLGNKINKNTPLKNKWHCLLKALRKYIGPLRNRIPMIERDLCAKNANLIDPAKVAGLALQRNKRALENLISLRDINRCNNPKNLTFARTTQPERIMCAENFTNYAKAIIEAKIEHCKQIDLLNDQLSNCTDEIEKLNLQNQIDNSEKEFQANAPKVHGGDTVFIHELVKQYERENLRNDLIEAQFLAMQSKLGSLSKMKILYVLDTSASMNGIPIQVGTGLVALTASTSMSEFRHKFISFSSKPKVMDCSNLNNGNPMLWDYMNYIKDNSIVSNTNIQLTIDLITNICKHTNVDEPLDMIIFLTDTQFDRITDKSTGFLAGDYLKKSFAQINKKAPLCCFWNLNGGLNSDSPAEPSESGIIMISGYSHIMLESLVQTIITASQTSLDELKAQKHAANQAFEEKQLKEEEDYQLNTFQIMLDFCQGDFSIPLREKLSELNQGIFANYQYKN